MPRTMPGLNWMYILGNTSFAINPDVLFCSTCFYCFRNQLQQNLDSVQFQKKNTNSNKFSHQGLCSPIWSFHFVVLQSTAKKCAMVCNTHAELLFSSLELLLNVQCSCCGCRCGLVKLRSKRKTESEIVTVFLLPGSLRKWLKQTIIIIQKEKKGKMSKFTQGDQKKLWCWVKGQLDWKNHW